MAKGYYRGTVFNVDKPLINQGPLIWLKDTIEAMCSM
jgi:hypothetical protein